MRHPRVSLISLAALAAANRFNNNIMHLNSYALPARALPMSALAGQQRRGAPNAPRHAATLSPRELRRIVSDMIG